MCPQADRLAFPPRHATEQVAGSQDQGQGDLGAGLARGSLQGTGLHWRAGGRVAVA